MKNKLSKFGEYYVNYGEYHDNEINKYIHIVCIPLILFSLQYLTRKIFRVAFIDTIYEISFPLILTISVAVYQCSKSKLCGILTLTWSMFFYYIQKQLYLNSLKLNYESDLTTTMIVIQIVSWIAQFIGHERAPALMSNLLLTLNAPFFVTAEILKMKGWKKEEFIQIDKEIFQRKQNWKNKKINQLNFH